MDLERRLASRQWKRAEHTMGKTVRYVTEAVTGDAWLFVFTDGTFLQAKAMVYDDETCELLSAEPLDVLDYYKDCLSETGLLTLEEYREWERTAAERRKESSREARRQQYESLKKEFDPEPIQVPS